MLNKTTTKNFHYQYANRCAEIDYMMFDIGYNEIGDKVDRYSRYTHDNLRDVLTEKLVSYSLSHNTRKMITSKDIDEVRLKKTYTVNWFESGVPQKLNFGTRDSAEKFAKIVRQRSKLVKIDSRQRVVVKREIA